MSRVEEAWKFIAHLTQKRLQFPHCRLNNLLRRHKSTISLCERTKTFAVLPECFYCACRICSSFHAKNLLTSSYSSSPPLSSFACFPAVECSLTGVFVAVLWNDSPLVSWRWISFCLRFDFSHKHENALQVFIYVPHEEEIFKLFPNGSILLGESERESTPPTRCFNMREL